ncbi:hypothetical protein [Streptomyces sp. NRRL B-3648]|uniref:hypothetical protein n=1 Tax=Streptomyces sp. NRRL B-3648 TaxID=1519493 RepID=UPI0006ADC4CF|nr:hypothetical protein [Streptomyces sp. NRRL B-3648]KOV91486.1 hypothetical protein ADL04_33325 [Streptomyces sp. NRRL B-3648]
MTFSRIGQFGDTLVDLVVITLCHLIADGTAIGPREKSTLITGGPGRERSARLARAPVRDRNIRDAAASRETKRPGKLDVVATEVYSRPRKALGGETPAERLGRGHPRAGSVRAVR